MAEVGHILDWGSNPKSYIDHVETTKTDTGESIELRFRRYSSTMNPDEVVYIRVIWLCCELQQISWPKYSQCARVVCLSSDSEVTVVSPSPVSNVTRDATAWALVRTITAYDRGRTYAGFREAVIAMSRHAEPGPLQDYLAGQADILLS